MSMISYAQNAEDVRLRRVFRDGPAGFYIDAGACHPVLDSVTKDFYERGWRGINIEPTSHAFELIRADRPRDINLNVGLSDRPGSLDLFEATDSLGRSTFSADYRDGWRAHDGCAFVRRSVPVTTLARVCAEHVDGPIDFLKVDVEGHERQVLEGADFARWRPRVAVIEGGPDAARAWEHLMLAARYEFAAFDGINRYYVREEDRDLIPALADPVSVADDFVPFAHHLALAEAGARVVAQAAQLDDVLGKLHEARLQLAAQAAQLDEARGQLRRYEGLGPGAVAVARRVKSISGRAPYLASLARRIVRPA